MSADLLRAMQLADTAFPTGAFAFSNGLETRVAEGFGHPVAVEALLLGQLGPRWLDFDRWFLAAAHAASSPEAQVAIDRDCELRQAVAALGEASRRQGRATLTAHARIATPGTAGYLARVKAADAPGHAAVAQGLAAAGLGLPLPLAEAAAFHAMLSGFAGAAVRLGALGALDAQGVVARVAAALAPSLAGPPPDLPFAFAPLADIAAARRPAQGARLFAN